MRNFLPLQHPAEQLRSFHAHRANQHRLTFRVCFFDFLDDGVVFFATRFVDTIVVIRPPYRPVRRNHVDVELVNVVELCRFRLGRAGHSRQLLIEAEIILDRNGRQGLRFAVDLHAFLGFHCLMQPVAPTAPRHFASGEFVDDDNLVVFDYILDVFLEQAKGAE